MASGEEEPRPETVERGGYEPPSPERAEWLMNEVLGVVFAVADGNDPQTDTSGDVNDGEFWSQVVIVLTLIKEIMPGVAEKDGTTGSWGFAAMQGDPEGDHHQVSTERVDPGSRLAMQLLTSVLNDDLPTATTLFFAHPPDVCCDAFVVVVTLAAQLVNRRRADKASEVPGG